jgi:putative chitinase
MIITYEQLRKIMITAPKSLDRFVEPLNAAMAEFEINNRARQTAFLASLGHESGSFRYMEELASGVAYEGRQDLGNHEPAAITAAAKYGMTPGKFFKGHGPIQITGYYNHRDCGRALGLDLIDEPELLCDPVHGCRAAAWFWKSRGLNEMADAGKFELITRRINGGMNGWEDRVGYLTRATEVLAA